MDDVKLMHFWITCCRVSTLPAKYSWSVYTDWVPAVVGKMFSLSHFQDCCCYSNSDVMYCVTKYCNVVGLHCTVRRDTACKHCSPDPSLSCRVDLACKTKLTHAIPSHSMHGHLYTAHSLHYGVMLYYTFTVTEFQWYKVLLTNA